MYMPGLNGSCSSALQPKDTCKETVTKLIYLNNIATLYIFYVRRLDVLCSIHRKNDSHVVGKAMAAVACLLFRDKRTRSRSRSTSWKRTSGGSRPCWA